MYHEFYPRIFTALGYPCEKYDGSYGWKGKLPDEATIKLVESLPPDEAQFMDADLGKINLPGLLQFQWEMRRKARMGAYPPIGDQIDMLYHAGNLPDDLTAAIKAVKDRYPKPAGVE